MASFSLNLPLVGSLIVKTFADLPASAVDGQIAVTADSGDIYTFDTTSSTWQPKGVTAGSGIVSINGETGNGQVLAVGTAGTDFAVVSAANTHTFNLPDASAANRGVITTGVQTIAGAKAFTGIVTVPDGSLGAPGLRFTTDNDTGFFQTGDGNLSIGANGTLKASFDQNTIDFYSVSQVTVNSDLDVTGALDVTGNISAANYPPTGNINTFSGFDNAGDLNPVPGFAVNTLSGGMDVFLVQESNNLSQNVFVHNLSSSIEPLQNSPNEALTGLNIGVNLDPNSTGFDIGTNGDAALCLNLGFNHQGTSDIGRLVMINSNSDIGNGTDPITIDGMAIVNGFGNIDNNVTIDGTIQGYGFQINVAASASGTSSFFGKAFYDNANFQIPVEGYYSVDLSPNLAAITNNHGFSGININQNITELQGNAGAIGVNCGGTIGTINSGSYQGVNVGPTVTLNKGNVTGLNVSMGNVTNYAGLQSSLVIQDITYTFNQFGDNNSYQIEYLDDTTAGNESFTIGGNLITCHMESGVSTATQIAAAAAANFSFASAVATVITGTGSNTQVAAAAANFTGGINPGTKKAAQFDGDVSINGALSFTGGLSIGALTSFASSAITSGLGVYSIDTLITQPTVAASATITGTDVLAINTAMLLQIGDNASVTSSFLGYAALGLPAVVTMGTGSTIDLVEGAIFAISLDAGATGGVIAEVDLCRSLAIPNGVTSVARLIGYKFDLPFGDPGTDTWGLYSAPTSAHNFMAGDLKVGGSDLPANSSVGIELESTTKAILLSRMTTTERDALTAVNGMQIYNSTTDKFQGYASGAWVDLH